MTRNLTTLAWLNVGLHAAGLGAAVLWIKQGTPIVNESARLDYLSGWPAGWIVGWSIWLLCAVAFGLFIFSANKVIQTPFAKLIPKLTVFAVVIDLICGLIQMLALPSLVDQPESFLMAEKFARLAGIIGANGVYSAIVLLISVSLMNSSKRVLYVGYSSAVGGFAMIPTEILGMSQAFQISTGIAIVFFSVWVVYVAADATKSGSPT